MVTTFAKANAGADVVTRAIVKGRLDSIVREMGIITMRTARSSIIYSGRDFSCALMDAKGQLLAVGTSVPLHIFPLIAQLQHIMEKFADDIHEGDVFIANDPYQGGTHLPDVAVICPIFFEGQLVGYSANRAHWTDVGGMTPGSISSDARSIFQEGLRLPAMKLWERGVIVQQIYDLITANVRVPGDVLGDLKAQLASCSGAEVRFRDLFARYSHELVAQHFAAILDDAETRMRNRIRRLGNTQQDVFYEDYLDSDGVLDEARKVCVRVSFQTTEILIDFTGSAAASRGPNNCSHALGVCYAFIAIKSVLDSEGSVNHGSFRPIRVVLPHGTFLSAVAPSPTGGMSETGFAVLAVFGALAGIAPDAVSAGETTAANHQFYGAQDPRFGTERYIVHYDYQAAGGGARAASDGLDVTRCIRSGSVQTASIEIFEQKAPIVYRRYELRPGSPGIGTFRGGHGVIRSFEVQQPGQYSGVLDNCVVPPFGVFKGHAGQTGRWQVHRDSKSFELSALKNRLDVLPGDVVFLQTQGGGGYGDPLCRDPALVLSDVRNELLTVAQARQLYGVVLSDDMKSIDAAATENLRQGMSASRLHVAVRKGEAAVHRFGIRQAAMGGGLRGVQSDDAIELHSEARAAPLRLIVKLDESLPEGTIELDHEIYDRLAIGPDEKFELRRLFSWTRADTRGGWGERDEEVSAHRP